MDSVIKWVWDILSTLFNWLLGVFSAAWLAITTFLQDLIFVPLDALLTLFEGMVNAIPVPASWSSVNPLGSLPGLTIYLLVQCGVLQCLLIIGAAFGVRFLLNLIPGAFTRI